MTTPRHATPPVAPAGGLDPATLAALLPPRVAFAETQTAALDELAGLCRATIRFGESLAGLGADALNRRPGPGRWSALECLEHLNRYADHYLPLLEARQVLAPARTRERYRAGLLGRPFALSLHPGRRAKRMRSPKDMNPVGSALDARAVVAAFRQNQARYAGVVAGLRGRDLGGDRVPMSILPIVRLRLGDMLHTLVWHNARHALQAAEAVG